MLRLIVGKKEDEKRIQSFIKASEAIYDADCMFILAENEGEELLAVMGFQVIDQFCLLRSFVFSSGFPAENLPLVFEKIIGKARELGCHSIGLATHKETNITFFEAFGFSCLEEGKVPDAVKLSTAYKRIQAFSPLFFMWKAL
ncbi:GNAT family N-acetyltransferase [Bacillus testis]|uniref:hypothetical protein n=1 Tax=Bacillus testis TaxID=1622072 RepID=UPI00067F61C1|nr:hypothetical protein [Bacillus testis]